MSLIIKPLCFQPPLSRHHPSLPLFDCQDFSQTIPHLHISPTEAPPFSVTISNSPPLNSTPSSDFDTTISPSSPPLTTSSAVTISSLPPLSKSPGREEALEPCWAGLAIWPEPEVFEVVALWAGLPSGNIVEAQLLEYPGRNAGLGKLEFGPMMGKENVVGGPKEHKWNFSIL